MPFVTEDINDVIQNKMEIDPEFKKLWDKSREENKADMKMKDGTHIVYGYECEVENGKITKIYEEDRHGVRWLAHIYKVDKLYGGYTRVDNMSVDAFRAAWKRDAVTVRR